MVTMENSQIARRIFCSDTLTACENIYCILSCGQNFVTLSEEQCGSTGSHFLHSPSIAVIHEAHGGRVFDVRGGRRRPSISAQQRHIICLAGADGGNGGQVG